MHKLNNKEDICQAALQDSQLNNLNILQDIIGKAKYHLKISENDASNYSSLKMVECLGEMKSIISGIMEQEAVRQTLLPKLN